MEEALLRLFQGDLDRMPRVMAAMMSNQQSTGVVTPGAVACAAITMPHQCGQGGTSLYPGETQQWQAGLVGNLALAQGMLVTSLAPTPTEGQPPAASSSGAATQTAITTPHQRGQGAIVLDPAEAQQLQAGLVGNLVISQGTLGVSPEPEATVGQPPLSNGSGGTQLLLKKVSPEPTLVAALKEMAREQVEEKARFTDMAHQGKQ